MTVIVSSRGPDDPPREAPGTAGHAPGSESARRRRAGVTEKIAATAAPHSPSTPPSASESVPRKLLRPTVSPSPRPVAPCAIGLSSHVFRESSGGNAGQYRQKSGVNQ